MQYNSSLFRTIYISNAHYKIVRAKQNQHTSKNKSSETKHPERKFEVKPNR